MQQGTEEEAFNTFQGKQITEAKKVVLVSLITHVIWELLNS